MQAEVPLGSQCSEPSAADSIAQIALSLESRVAAFLQGRIGAADAGDRTRCRPDSAAVGRRKQELFAASQALCDLCGAVPASHPLLASCVANLQECIDGLRVYLIRNDFAHGIPAACYREVMSTLLAFKAEVNGVAKEVMLCGDGARGRRVRLGIAGEKPAGRGAEREPQKPPMPD